MSNYKLQLPNCVCSIDAIKHFREFIVFPLQPLIVYNFALFLRISLCQREVAYVEVTFWFLLTLVPFQMIPKKKANSICSFVLKVTRHETCFMSAFHNHGASNGLTGSLTNGLTGQKSYRYVYIYRARSKTVAHHHTPLQLTFMEKVFNPDFEEFESVLDQSTKNNNNKKRKAPRPATSNILFIKCFLH